MAGVWWRAGSPRGREGVWIAKAREYAEFYSTAMGGTPTAIYKCRPEGKWLDLRRFGPRGKGATAYLHSLGLPNKDAHRFSEILDLDRRDHPGWIHIAVEATRGALMVLGYDGARTMQVHEVYSSKPQDALFVFDPKVVECSRVARSEAKENPVAGGLICMGREVELDLREPPIGRSGGSKTIVPPKDAGMLFDASGAFWPKCSLLIADFTRGTEEVEAGKDYFGRGAAVFEGEVELPPKELSAWQKLGEIKTIFYERAGVKHPGFFRHTFNRPKGLYKLIFLVKGKAAKEPAMLFTLFQRRTNRTFYRIELPGGCIVDDRGIVLP